MSTLIVGGDSRLARELTPLLQREQKEVFLTTRRNVVLQNNQLFLNLPNTQDFEVPSGTDSVVIAGGVISYDECVNKFDYAYDVNCNAIPKLVEGFLRDNIYVCYISSNVVFKKDFPPKEDELVCPGFEYAVLKAEAEKKLLNVAAKLGKSRNISILRFTKNVSYDTSPFKNWINSIRSGLKINAFNDLYFAPIRFVDSAMAIKTIIEQKPNGIFHLSGEKDISYYEFALGLFDHLSLSRDLVVNVSSADVGVNLIYNHPVTALNMNFTSQVLGLKPVSLDTVYDYLKLKIGSLD
ncbi:MAG: sugar nucleotide-binding protein [Oscillatoria sp. SIO1A7]|nr:sugar nucleotide-binding protein [Oscillatoria sp. SIO1A7]